MEQALIDRYRCPESFVKFDLIGRLSKEAGYFRFGPLIVCAKGIACKRWPSCLAVAQLPMWPLDLDRFKAFVSQPV